MGQHDGDLYCGDVHVAELRCITEFQDRYFANYELVDGLAHGHAAVAAYIESCLAQNPLPAPEQSWQVRRDAVLMLVQGTPHFVSTCEIALQLQKNG